MKVFLCIIGLIAYTNALSMTQCSQGSKIKVKSVNVTPSPGVLTKDKTVEIGYENNAQVTASDRLEATLEIRKKVFFLGFVKIPTSLISLAAKKLQDPDIQHMGGSKFQLGCPTLQKYIPCPPPTGTNTERVTLNKLFEEMKKLSGTFGSWLASGTYRVNVVANKVATASSPGNDLLVCVDVEAEISI
ncbi:uncharacterized protein LOC130622628 [Hydractinia symbiolongicarpus]|uniref:uncharacterized protein LOC130622628 n=1 Tax=Hydractinia symbiolongicarpus TaxID=13093 RepID=UPI00254B081B|nr:uncharacterized protein LOC130622628 [Hydractinia symbiolongicarpus]